MKRFAAIIGVTTLAIALWVVPGDAGRRQIYDETADGRTQIEEALEEAEDSGKLVLITWGANWCGWCHHLEDQMEASRDVQKLLNEHHIAIHIDMGHRDKHMDLAREYGLEFNDLKIAHMTVLDAQGKVVGNQTSGDRLVTLDNGDKIYSAELVAEFLRECISRSESD